MSDEELQRIEPGAINALGRNKPFVTTNENFAQNSQAQTHPEHTPTGQSQPTPLISMSTGPTPAKLMAPPSNQTSFIEKLSTAAKQAIPIVGLVSFVSVFLCTTTYGGYTFIWKTKWYQELEALEDKAPMFRFKCDVMAFEARWMTDSDQLDFLHEVGCPGVHRALNRMTPQSGLKKQMPARGLQPPVSVQPNP